MRRFLALLLALALPAQAQLLPPLPGGSLVVSMSSPANGATVSGSVTVGASVTIVGTLTVTRVDFYADNSLIGSDTSAPYAIAWDSRAVANGTHSLKAVAQDILGARWSANPISVTVGNGPPPDSTAPSVSITAPANGATVSGTINVTASASDNVGVTGVQFLLDGASLGAQDTSAPYGVSWNTTLSGNGTHTLTAVARDAAGNTRTSAPISVTVANGPPPDSTAPSVSITAPANGATVSGTINVSASASDNVGVAGVEFALDGVVRADDTSAPYSIPWDTRTVSDGTHTLAAVARDAAGNRKTSATITVTVSNAPPPDTTAPSVSITSPANGATVSGTISVSASASDNVGVVGVEFVLDGVVRADDASAPYSIPWDTRTVSDGTHTLAAVARDAAGNRKTSAVVTVTVANAPPPDTTAPSVSITAPANGATVSGTINVSASASDNVGVVGVEFLLDGAVLADDASAPYEIDWDSTAASDGEHVLTARARDAAGNSATSVPVSVTVANGGGGAARFEEDHPAVSAAGAWAKVGAEVAAFSDGTAGASNAAGSSVTFRFNGTGVSWIGLKCSACGIAAVRIDGGAPVSVDTAGAAAPGAPGLASAPVFSASGLAPGDHTLTLTVTGETSAGNAYVIVDAFDVTGGSGSAAVRIEETGPGVSAAGPWSLRGAETAAFSGGAAGSADSAGATLALDFDGTAVSWIGLRCNVCGIATVQIDGGAPASVDTAGPAAPGSAGLASAPVFDASGLAAGRHRLTITVTGDTTSGGAHVIVDAFDVTP